MSEFRNIVEYDKKGRVIRIEVSEPNIVITYEYRGDNRICTSNSPSNNTNHVEAITQKKIKNAYIDIEKYQEGEIYDVMTRYDEFGNEIYLTRVNKNTSSIYRKKTIRNKYGISKIWFEEYNGVISMGFKVDIEKILKKTC